MLSVAGSATPSYGVGRWFEPSSIHQFLGGSHSPVIAADFIRRPVGAGLVGSNPTPPTHRTQHKFIEGSHSGIAADC